LTIRLLASAVVTIAAPARAEVGAVISAYSDARFRGVSVSGGDPVAVLDLSYDDPSGAYAAASGTAVASGGIRPLSLQLNAGYAKSLGDLTLDFGVLQSNYSRYSTTVHGSAYTEVYAGLSRKNLTARVHLSPHYFGGGTWTLYGELNHALPLSRRLSLNSHIGMVIPLRTRGPADDYSQFDWRVGLDQAIGRFALHAAVTGARGVRHYESGGGGGRAALVVGVSFIL